MQGEQPEVIELGDGVVYEPWSDGRTMGYKVTRPDKPVIFIYLNPSDHTDEGDPDVFVYQGRSGAPAEDMPLHWYGLDYTDGAS